MTNQAPIPNGAPLPDEMLMADQALMINHMLTANQARTTKETLTEDIYIYIKKEFNHSNDFDLATSIVKEGLIDSMGILTLVSFLEKRYRVEIDFEDITPDNFKNVRAIAGFIKKLRG